MRNPAVPALLVLAVLTHYVAAADYAFENAQRAQRAADAQRAMRNYTNSYIEGVRSSNYNTPNRETGRTRWVSNYQAPKTTPSDAETERVTRARRDPAKPKPLAANYDDLVSFYRSRGFSEDEATMWTNFDLRLAGVTSGRDSGYRGNSGNVSVADNGSDGEYWARRGRELDEQARVRREKEADQYATRERQALAGDPAAMRELANHGKSAGNLSGLQLMERAAELGDKEAMLAAFDWRIRDRSVFDADIVLKWGERLAQAGEASSAFYCAQWLTSEKPEPDFPRAVRILEVCFAAKSDFSVGRMPALH